MPRCVWTAENARSPDKISVRGSSLLGKDGPESSSLPSSRQKLIVRSYSRPHCGQRFICSLLWCGCPVRYQVVLECGALLALRGEKETLSIRRCGIVRAEISEVEERFRNTDPASIRPNINRNKLIVA